MSHATDLWVSVLVEVFQGASNVEFEVVGENRHTVCEVPAKFGQHLQLCFATNESYCMELNYSTANEQ